MNGAEAPVLTLTREEIVRMLNEAATKRLGFSAGEFLWEYEHGRLADPGRVADLLALAALLSDDDPLLVDARREILTR